MSVRDNDKKIIITECLTGKVIAICPYDDVSTFTLQYILFDMVKAYIDKGVMIKIGY